MPSKSPPRLASVLASTLAAGLLLAVAGCGHDTPAPAAQDRASTHSSPVRSQGVLTRARSPFVLKAVRSQPATGSRACPARSFALTGGPGQCYRQLGKPVIISSATVGPVITDALDYQGLYGFWIVLHAADVAPLRALTASAAAARASLAISVADRGWLLPIPGRPFTNGQLEIFLPRTSNSLASRNRQVLELHHMLVSPS
jgi:hypothetical protein